MNFYEKLDELIESLKETSDYRNFLELKENIKKDERLYAMLKDFKEKQTKYQINYINGTKMNDNEQAQMQNLYSIIIQNDDARKLLECEMRLDAILADMQRKMGAVLEEIVKF